VFINVPAVAVDIAKQDMHNGMAMSYENMEKIYHDMRVMGKKLSL